jgi:sugar-phosphatase
MRTVLFDVDGVVLDSMGVFRRVWDRWSVLSGLDPEAVWPLTHGRRPRDTIALVAPQLQVELEFRHLEDLLPEEGPALAAMPGAQILLAALPTPQWALVTSNSERLVRVQFERLLLPSPALVIDLASVREGKPSPEGYILAASLLGADPEECLVVEDAPAGVEAGRAAGMRVMALMTSHPADDLTSAHLVFPALSSASSTIREWVLAPSAARKASF